MSPETQVGLILRHLKRGSSLWAGNARRLYACEHLRSRIAELRAAGHRIRTSRTAGRRITCYSL